MILPLRQRHRRMFLVIGVLLPITFVIGIAARRAVPQVVKLPSELLSWSQTLTAADFDRADLFTNSPVWTRLWREQNTGRYAVGFVAEQDFVKPDLMVYWIAGHPHAPDKLPPEATLLGAFSGGPLLLPVEATTADGVLILFSLANHEIVDVSKPTRFGELTK
jgi:hypothetical protein